MTASQGGSASEGNQEKWLHRNLFLTDARCAHIITDV